MKTTYTLKRYHRSKHIRLRVEPDGSVLVTAPKRARLHDIEAFVKQSQSWIDSQLHTISQKKELYPLLDERLSQVRVLGMLKPYKFDISITERVEERNKEIAIYPYSGKREDVLATLTNWLKRKARQTITPLVEKRAEEMETSFQSLTLRQQKSRWGSCSSRKNLNFNWRLVHFSPGIIDYVVVHELAHLTHLDHSANFWRLVRHYVPDYRLKRDFLKQQVVELY